MEYYSQVFDQTFPAQWAGQEFEECTFKKLDLSRTAFTNTSFVNCHFEGCNLTRAELKNTKLYDIRLSDCNLMHVDFSPCNEFGFYISSQRCRLDYTIYIDRKLKKGQFIDCSMKETQFIKCDLTGTVFKHCNLELARFEGNNLSQADFTSSYNLELNPDDNKLKKARFSLHNLPGLLTRYDLVISE